MAYKRIQSYSMVDGNPHDSFEGLVELYYQFGGYITSSNKNFWVYRTGKDQRGYQDIDVLAVKQNQTVIVSVSTNLDDKVNTSRIKSGTLEHFKRVRTYLEAVEDYRWLIQDGRTVRKVIAYMSGYKTVKSLCAVLDLLAKHKIELLSVYEISDYLLRRIKTLKDPKEHGLKAENELVRLLQVWLKVENYQEPTEPGHFIPEWEMKSKSN